MAKFTGSVGYVTQEESSPGVWSPVDTIRPMKGDIIKQSATSQNDYRAVTSGNKVNSDITLGHRVSLFGDAYAFKNYFDIKWIEIDGLKWAVTSVELQRPRILISLGGMWNGY
jgi:hypothetical protein